MKKTKRAVALLLAAILAVGCLGFAAYAVDSATDTTPTVIFDAKTGEFSFENCGENGTDLFRDFKNVMPGDYLTQHIRVKVLNAGSNTVKIMLRSGESNAAYAKLLGMKVQSDGSWVRDDSIGHPATLTAVIPKLSGETVTVTEWFKDKIKGVLNLKDATIDPYIYSGTLAEGVYLGAYSESSQQEINVTLAIPVTAGNELQGLRATVDWIFTAEVIPYNPPTDIPDEPTPTLDTVNHFAYIIGRKDGLVHPEAPITRGEFAAIAARFDSDPYHGDDRFTDISGHWAAGYINQAAVKGWVEGQPDGSFAPDRSITRAEAMTTINRVLGRLPETADDLLDDMIAWPDNPPDAWYYLAVQEATNSHDYTWAGTGAFEVWTELLPNRDWAALEEIWSQANDAPGGEVMD